MRVLLVGFGPFPGAPFNPSASLVTALARRRRPALADTFRTTHVFATTYSGVDRDLPALFAEKPDIVLMVGLAGRTRHLRIETRARNAVSVLFPDAGGYRPADAEILSGGPPARRGRAPFAHLLAAARGNALRVGLSRDAGRYLCNYAYWKALERARDGRPLVQFVHIPPIRTGSRPLRQRKHHQPSLATLVAASERLLMALLAARRR
jgi:pyroglutamyl-peptidase